MESEFLRQSNPFSLSLRAPDFCSLRTAGFSRDSAPQLSKASRENSSEEREEKSRHEQNKHVREENHTEEEIEERNTSQLS